MWVYVESDHLLVEMHSTRLNRAQLYTLPNPHYRGSFFIAVLVEPNFPHDHDLDDLVATYNTAFKKRLDGDPLKHPDDVYQDMLLLIDSPLNDQSVLPRGPDGRVRTLVLPDLPPPPPNDTDLELLEVPSNLSSLHDTLVKSGIQERRAFILVRAIETGMDLSEKTDLAYVHDAFVYSGNGEPEKDAVELQKHVNMALQILGIPKKELDEAMAQLTSAFRDTNVYPSPPITPSTTREQPQPNTLAAGATSTPTTPTPETSGSHSSSGTLAPPGSAVDYTLYHHRGQVEFQDALAAPGTSGEMVTALQPPEPAEETEDVQMGESGPNPSTSPAQADGGPGTSGTMLPPDSDTAAKTTTTTTTPGDTATAAAAAATPPPTAGEDKTGDMGAKATPSPATAGDTTADTAAQAAPSPATAGEEGTIHPSAATAAAATLPATPGATTTGEAADINTTPATSAGATEMAATTSTPATSSTATVGNKKAGPPLTSGAAGPSPSTGDARNEEEPTPGTSRVQHRSRRSNTRRHPTRDENEDNKDRLERHVCSVHCTVFRNNPALIKEFPAIPRGGMESEEFQTWMRDTLRAICERLDYYTDVVRERDLPLQTPFLTNNEVEEFLESRRLQQELRRQVLALANLSNRTQDLQRVFNLIFHPKYIRGHLLTDKISDKRPDKPVMPKGMMSFMEDLARELEETHPGEIDSEKFLTALKNRFYNAHYDATRGPRERRVSSRKKRSASTAAKKDDEDDSEEPKEDKKPKKK